MRAAVGKAEDGTVVGQQLDDVVGVAIAVAAQREEHQLTAIVAQVEVVVDLVGGNTAVGGDRADAVGRFGFVIGRVVEGPGLVGQSTEQSTDTGARARFAENARLALRVAQRGDELRQRKVRDLVERSTAAELMLGGEADEDAERPAPGLHDEVGTLGPCLVYPREYVAPAIGMVVD